MDRDFVSVFVPGVIDVGVTTIFFQELGRTGTTPMAVPSFNVLRIAKRYPFPHTCVHLPLGTPGHWHAAPG